MRRLTLVSSSALMVALCTLLACGGQPQTGEEPTPNDPQSGGLEGAPSEEPVPAGQGDENPGNPLGVGKVTICHIPPGNPANAHTITVGLPALKAHTKHGDTLGACGGGDVDAGPGPDVDAGPGPEVDAGSGDVDAGPGPGADAGSGDVDAGSPECAPVGATCGGGVACCDGLTCGPEGYCEPIIG
ncbi:hypothetical protein [Pyxidicoccus trucidator]|uniref:hypothetical protein n=1 Tax=Pyxidicoccus trucidator TaxID=2709662 RepID=UPI0013D9447A|nr:hypothetical protein [Pyxidicoccus trucidator]